MNEPGSELEGAAHGFPALRDLTGRKLADGEFAQWLEAGRLHVRITYQFGPAKRVEEQAVFQQEPRLVQDAWSWRELENGKPLRQYEVDFKSGRATAQKQQDKKVKRWSEDLKIQPGRTFAGFGFALALKGLRERLIRGEHIEHIEHIELLAVAFTPKPQVVPVEVSYGGVDHMEMGERVLKGDRFVIHPKIPKIAKLFVNAPDTRIWLTTPPPASFLRWEGQLVEPSDPVIRVDRLPGNRSGPARAGSG